MQAETRFKKRIWPKLLVIPHSWWHKTQDLTRRGIPDFLGCIGPYFVSIELKTEVGDTDPLQDYTLAKIRKTGAMAIVLHPRNQEQCFETLWALAQQVDSAHETAAR